MNEADMSPEVRAAVQALVEAITRQVRGDAVPERPPLPRGKALSPDDLARRWQVSADFVRKIIKTGELPAWKFGGKLLRIRPEDAEAYERECARSEH